MWYLLSKKDGLIQEALSKKEIMENRDKAERYGLSLDKCYYKVTDKEQEFLLVSSKEQAIDLGFDWVFKIPKEKKDKSKELKIEKNKKEINTGYILRDYQKNQLGFIENRIDIADIIGLESPTGSGKTVTFLTFIKEWLEKPENHLSNVVISTGFNNLVFQLEERCLEMGLDAKVLIGTKACNCPELMKEKGLKPKVFTLTDKYRCGDKHKYLDTSTNNWAHKVCPHTQDLYREYFQSIMNNVGQVIITNHSSLLVHQDSLINTSLLIIDEAHTFGMFYDSYLKLELDKNDLTILDEAINSIPSPMSTIIKMNLKRGAQLPAVQIDKICEQIEEGNVRAKVKEFFETKPDRSNWIEKTSNSFTIDKFYRSFELKIKPKILLFSATLDDFTLNMFNVRKSNFYKEYKTFCDYSKSEFIAIPNEDFKESLQKFIKYVNDKELNSGLILSTTIVDMNIALKFDGFCNYKMFNNLKEFEKFKGKKILVGSRALFQGVDIQDLDFVALNKIPFPTWDDKTRALQDYLTNGGKNDFDPWKQFTIPKTENDIIQSTGRLWRSVNSKGVVSIFDPRVEKFRYIMRHVFDRYRHGIKTYIMNNDGSISNFPLKEKD